MNIAALIIALVALAALALVWARSAAKGAELIRLRDEREDLGAEVERRLPPGRQGARGTLTDESKRPRSLPEWECSLPRPKQASGTNRCPPRQAWWRARDLFQMDFEDTIDALATLEGRAVEVDHVFLRPLPGFPTDLRGCTGILRRLEMWEVDESWQTFPPGAYYEVFPAASFLIRTDRLQGARWQGEILEIDVTPDLRLRVIPLLRADGLAPVPAPTHRIKRGPLKERHKFAPGMRVVIKPEES